MTSPAGRVAEERKVSCLETAHHTALMREGVSSPTHWSLPAAFSHLGSPNSSAGSPVARGAPWVSSHSKSLKYLRGGMVIAGSCVTQAWQGEENKEGGKSEKMRQRWKKLQPPRKQREKCFSGRGKALCSSQRHGRQKKSVSSALKLPWVWVHEHWLPLAWRSWQNIPLVSVCLIA